MNRDMGDRITVHPGRTLWDELAEQKIRIERPCGGKGVCGRCQLVLRGGRKVLACQYRTVGEVEIEQFPESFADAGPGSGKERRFQAVGMLREHRELYVPAPIAAVDIGTTTVVVCLLYQNDRIERSFVNPQRAFGTDVMSRIRAAGDGQGGALRELIWVRLLDTLDSAFEELASKNAAERRKCTLIISANTTMQHLLEGLSCRGLGSAPFVPERLELRSFFMGGMRVVQLPGISAFVGADIVSGLCAVDILSRDAPVLFVDLGTNGELALGCRDRLIVASTAAGPAFEGSDLAVQIHGAGMLNLLHELLERKVLDEYGTFQDEYFENGYPVGERSFLTQDEVRRLQMAKAAVCAGVELLLDAYGILAEQVNTVYLAGGFGRYLDPEDALAVGLLPAGLRGRIAAAGNTSLEGAVMYAADPERYGRRMDEICRRAELLSLPDCAGFEERYIERMNFGLYGN